MNMSHEEIQAYTESLAIKILSCPTQLSAEHLIFELQGAIEYLSERIIYPGQRPVLRIVK